MPFKKGHKINLGKKHSQEAKLNISNSLKGRIAWNKGIKAPQISKGKLGKNFTEEHCKHLSESHMGQYFGGGFKKGVIPWNKGKKLSAEHLIKISRKLMGRSSPRKGIKLSYNVKFKIGLGNLGKKQSDETKRKIGLAALGRPSFWKGKFGNQSANWKGEEIGYRGLHRWINNKLGKAKECEYCSKEGIGHQIHWANKNHSYKRNLVDWISLCTACHLKYDRARGLRD